MCVHETNDHSLSKKIVKHKIAIFFHVCLLWQQWRNREIDRKGGEVRI